MPISSAEDIDPSGLIAHVATRQFELISNDQTNLYQSLVGNSFMSSVLNYNISQQAKFGNPPSEATATLRGLTNSVSAMLDDMLVPYASAQLMVGNQSTVTETVVTTSALKIGTSEYIIAMCALNVLILLIVVEEAIRTSFWRGLGKWNYMDVGTVVVSSWNCGRTRAGETMNRVSRLHSGSDRDRGKNDVGDDYGKTWIRLDEEADTLLLK